MFWKTSPRSEVSETIIDVLSRPEGRQTEMNKYRVVMGDGYVVELLASDYDTAMAKAVYQSSLYALDLTHTLQEFHEAITVRTIEPVEV